MIRDGFGADHMYSVQCISPILNLPFFHDVFYPRDSLQTIEWTTMPCDIGYVNLDNLETSNVNAMYKGAFQIFADSFL